MFQHALTTAFAVFVALGLPEEAPASALRIATVLGGKVELSLPAELAPADDETQRSWHPSDMAPPEALFVDATNEVSVALNVQRLPSMTTSKLLSAMVRGIRKSESISWHADGKRQINGRKFGFVEFTAYPSPERGIYNYIYFTFDGDQLIQFVVNCTAEKRPDWQPRLHDVVASTRIVTKS